MSNSSNNFKKNGIFENTDGWKDSITSLKKDIARRKIYLEIVL